MLSLAMHLGLATPLAFMAPHTVAPAPPPPPIVAVVPHELGPSSNDRGAPVAAIRGGGGDQAQGASAPTTTSTTIYSGIECVVTLTDSLGNSMTYSPGPAVNGVCDQGTPEPVTATS